MVPSARRRALAAAAFALSLAPLAARADEARIDWQVDAWDAQPGQAQLTLAYRRPHDSSVEAGPVALAELQGLTEAALHGGAPQLVRFHIVRDAGTFACDGSAGRDHGSGECQFQPSAGFVQLLRARGAGEATSDQLLDLAMAGFSATTLEELRREGYAPAKADALVRLAQHGVTLTWLKGMDAAGYRLGQVDYLVRVRDHGVGPRYVAELQAAGYRGLNADELVRLRDHGVTTDFIHALAQLGYRDFAAEELVQLRDHGVTAGYVRALSDLGYRQLSSVQLVRLRDHGVTTGFIQKVNAGGPPREPEEIVRLRDRDGF